MLERATFGLLGIALLALAAACSGATPTPTPTATPNAVQAARAAMLYERAAEIRDQYVRDIEHCRFLIDAAGFERGSPLDPKSGSRFNIRAELYRGADGSWLGPVSRQAYEEDWLREAWDRESFNPAVWFPAKYEAFVGEEPKGTHIEESTHLGKPAARYEMHFSEDGSEFVKISDYLLENPYVFNQSTYKILGDGERLLVTQQARSEFTLHSCTSGDNYNAVHQAARQHLSTQAREAYNDLEARVANDCFGGYRQDVFRSHGIVYSDTSTLEIIPDAEGWITRREHVKMSDPRYSDEPDRGWRTDSVNHYQLDEQGNWRRISESEYTEHREMLEPFDSPFDFIDKLPLTHTPFGFPVKLNQLVYSGESEIDGEPALRYEGVTLYADDRLVLHRLVVAEYVKGNPMLYRVRIYDLEPDTFELTLRHDARVSEIPASHCTP